MKPVDFFEGVEATLLTDVLVDTQFDPKNKSDLIKTGKRGERVLKAGSVMYVKMTPSGVFHMSDSIDSIVCHAELSRNQFEVTEDVEFPESYAPSKTIFGLWERKN